MVSSKLMFTVSVTADKPVVVGQDSVNGRRQLINCPSGTVEGVDPDGKPFSGVTLPCTIDSQVIRPNGVCELSARYGIRLDDGRSFYIENNGIRTVPPEYVETVLNGGFVDPDLYYFVTTPKIEAYDDSLRWMERHVFLCKATRTPSAVEIRYYMVEK
ncbi:MAG: DUF3237 domain-containing protein [Oscillospiraceae bacterium]|nr:DUF3237 domain-containing protein [Oscillospiraceae bacterium]